MQARSANNCVYRLNKPQLNLKAEIMNIFRPDDDEMIENGQWPIRSQIEMLLTNQRTGEMMRMHFGEE